eukprot:7107061-Alexandrium_andersonii.AAC.1
MCIRDSFTAVSPPMVDVGRRGEDKKRASSGAWQPAADCPWRASRAGHIPAACTTPPPAPKWRGRSGSRRADEP